MVEPKIEFIVQLTEKDIAGMYDDASAHWRKWCLLPGVAIAIAGIAIFVMTLPDWPGAAITVAVIGALLIYCGTFMVGAFRRASVRCFRLNPSAQQKMHYRVFDDHLTVTSTLTYSELRWQAFLSTKEIPGYISLILEPRFALVIPLKYLSPSQALDFRELVKSRIQPPPTKGRPLFRTGP